MKIKWYGHAAFLITSNDGTKVIIDPYDPNAFPDRFTYGPIRELADIVLITHEHRDHNGAEGIPGSPKIVKGTGIKTIKGISIKGLSVFHDASDGSERGENIVFTLSIDGISICHLGDLGHVLRNNDLAEIGSVDILLLPVGGYYTIDAEMAAQVAGQIKPKVLIPMHFKTKKCEFPIASVEDFLLGKPKARRYNSSEITFNKENLPRETEILVLDHAL